jgi:predicted dehydrogenase
MGDLGVVVVGTGFGCLTHARALRAAGLDLQALVGRDPAKTVARAARFEIPLATTDLDEALALPGVEAVTVATPPHAHASVVRACLAAGKHVLCEKPFARDLAEARQLHELAEASGLVTLLGTEFRFDTGQALLARAVADGLVGDPKIITVLLHVGALADPDAEVPDWWADAAHGGGWLGAHGSQVIDQIRATCGEFTAVSAALPHVVDRPMSAEDSFLVSFRLRSGAVGTMQSSAADWGHPILITRVTGSRGTAWIEALGDVVNLADRDGVRRLPIPDELRTPSGSPPPPDLLKTSYEQMHSHGLDLGPYTRLAQAFRARIVGEPWTGPAPATFADGVADMAVLDAIRTAAATGEWVTVDQTEFVGSTRPL